MKRLAFGIVAILAGFGAMAQTIEEETRKYYASSHSQAANDFYKRGNGFLETHNYHAAIEEYKRAVELDPNFVLAWDNLAVSYRRLKHFPEAAEAYKKSLSVFPRGEFALVNLGVVYVLQNDLANAEATYAKVVQWYPANPEGHYGLSEIALMRGQYEDALHPICRAHTLYVNANSDNTEDSKKILEIIYKKLKEAGKEHLFQDAIGKHGIDFKVE